MSIKQDLEKVREQLACADYSNYSFNELMDQYDTLKAIQRFDQTQPTYYTSPPSFVPPFKKAKEIALNAAIACRPLSTGGQLGNIAGSYDILPQAEKIYQWLIKDTQP